MTPGLQISLGQYSDKGRKATNQDFHGALIPNEPLLSLKGIAIVMADGISSSSVSQVASESAVKSFLTDYYCTSEVMVGEDVGPAGVGGNQRMAAFSNPTQPIRL